MYCHLLMVHNAWSLLHIVGTAKLQFHFLIKKLISRAKLRQYYHKITHEQYKSDLPSHWPAVPLYVPSETSLYFSRLESTAKSSYSAYLVLFSKSPRSTRSLWRLLDSDVNKWRLSLPAHNTTSQRVFVDHDVLSHLQHEVGRHQATSIVLKHSLQVVYGACRYTVERTIGC